MPNLRQLLTDVLANGKVEGQEIERLRRELYADGKVGRPEADCLVQMHKQLQRKTPGFENFFYQAIKDHLLADGKIDAEEVTWLRQMLDHDGRVDERERKFLHELRGEARERSPEFEALYAECSKP